MATINIGQANADDQFYRYKMPKLQARVSVQTALHAAPGLCAMPWCPFLWLLAPWLLSSIKSWSCVTSRASSRPFQCYVLLLQIEGRGNGIKTNVVNNVEIAKALERPPDCESHCAALACYCWAAAASAAC